MIGQALTRVDGPLKVAGRATYAYEHWEAGQPLYGFIVGATIGKGRITRIDTARAERSPGVHMVMTHLNAPAQGTPDLSMLPESERPALARTLAKEPKKRWPSCRALVDAIRASRPLGSPRSTSMPRR